MQDRECSTAEWTIRSPSRDAAVQAQQTAVHRIGAGRRERDLVRLYAERLGGRRARVVEHEAGGPARVVDPPGVGVRRVEGGLERLPRRRVQRLSGRGVQVDPGRSDTRPT